MSNRYPLRVTSDQWNDVREHYEDDEDREPPERDEEYETWLDDFDRRVDDLYSMQQGDLGDEIDPPF